MPNRYISDFVGTFKNFIRIAAVRLKNNSGTLEVRDAGDTAYAAVGAAAVNFQGATSGAVVFQAPATAAGTYTLPDADGSTNQVLSTNGAGTLSWATVAMDANTVRSQEEVIAFGSSSPVTIFTPPANSKIERVTVEVETAFDGTPSLSVGVAGTASRYMGTTDMDLAVAALYDVSPMYEEDGTPEAVIVTYSAGGASVGSARVTVYYTTPA